ncbi:MAG: PadR family transcriptional regulator [Halobacteriales archaeon]|nr:PadR family transcriptional regulator [Halobacteriales archaeon]
MPATMPRDRRLLRALRRGPAHGYGLAQELAGEADRATVYRRLGALQRAGLVHAQRIPGSGPDRKLLRLSPSGDAALRDELRDAMQLLLAAFDAQRPRGGEGMRLRGPIVVVSGSKLSAIELRILATFAQHAPRQTHLVLSPGARLPGAAPPGVAVSEAPWSALPFRDGYAKLLLCNEAPPSSALARAAREWGRVLHARGTLHVVGTAPLPRGVDPFVDFLAGLHAELFPDVARGPPAEALTEALRGAFRTVREEREADQLVWTARGPR